MARAPILKLSLGTPEKMVRFRLYMFPTVCIHIINVFNPEFHVLIYTSL